MIGDAAKLLNVVRNPETLRRAFRYALRDRPRDYYCELFELEEVSAHEEAIVSELAEELRAPGKYEPRPAYAYFPPKNHLCYRRMIYIPFKDLVVRYAFVLVLSDLLDADLSPRCFANRRAHGDTAEVQLLEDFASKTWPAFCKWQKDCAENPNFSTLLRTDISAFYDAVSHDDLVRTIARQLNISPDVDVMQLFRKLLKVSVVAYSHLDGRHSVQLVHQGLSIGNNTEGVLANFYLRAVDEAMGAVSDVEFGRYNDDMRIFAADRESARRAMLILQERLLTKGLNLNSAKTKLEEGATGVEDLRSKAYELYDYGLFDEGEPETGQALPVEDCPFDEFDRNFEPGDELKDERDAKDFCQFLGRVLPLEERQPAHIETLKGILSRWHGSSKHASWRLIETIARNKCPAATKASAVQALLDCLRDGSTSTYAKYRLLHYLVRRIGLEAQPRRYIDNLEVQVKDTIRQMLPSYLEEPAFEMNIIALYTMKVLGSSPADLEAAVQQHMAKPVAGPIRNALMRVGTAPPPVAAVDVAGISDDEGQEDVY